MSAKTIATAAFALLIFGSALFIFSTQQKETAPELDVIGTPQSIRVNQTITLKVKAADQQQMQKITSINNQEQKEAACTQNTCNTEFEYSFSKQGAHQIEFIAQNIFGKTSSKKIIIKVIQNYNTCIDSTQANQCSKKKPLYCENQNLIEKCGQCGCPDGMQCQQNACRPIAKKLQIISATPIPAKIIKENSKFSAKIELKNLEHDIVAMGAQYKIIANLIEATRTETQKEFSLESELKKNESVQIEINFEGIKSGNYSIEIELLENQNMLSDFVVQNFIEVSNEKKSPAAPTGFKAVLTGENANLSWNPNQEIDLAGYKIYKSASVEPTHIKYALYQTVQSQTTSLIIEKIGKGKHYFVIKAFDFLENESQYSQTAKIEKS